jgi:hypothetical protein
VKRMKRKRIRWIVNLILIVRKIRISEVWY